MSRKREIRVAKPTPRAVVSHAARSRTALTSSAPLSALSLSAGLPEHRSAPETNRTASHNFAHIPLFSPERQSAPVQTKLSMGAPGDKYEQEADRIADNVMNMTASPVSTHVDGGPQQAALQRVPWQQTRPLAITPLVQRQTALADKEEEEAALQSQSENEAEEEDSTVQAKPLIESQAENEEEERELELQSKTIPGRCPAVTSGVASGINAMQGRGQALSPETRSFMEPRFGHDFSRVRIHADNNAANTSRQINARAFTVGNTIAFGAGQYQPNSSQGKRLLAHELTHVVQQSKVLPETNAHHVAKKTEGEKARGRAKGWLQVSDKVKVETDILKAAIREIKKEKSVDYNRKAGLKKIDNAAKILGLSAAKLANLKTDWIWLVDNRTLKAKASYKRREAKFFSLFHSPLTKIKKKYPGQQTHYWLKNAPAQVLEIIIKVADADIPANELWAYAFKEGLVDYIRDEIGLAATTDPTEAELKGVSVTKTISGFNYLGLDDFFSELSTKRSPMKGFLPKGFELKKVKEVKRINEKGRTVRSGEFPNMLMAVQGLLAMLKRRRTIFKQDAKAFGYAAPTQEETVYWTYLYFNVGEFGGKNQLKKYKGKRKLSDWIKKKEYPNSIKLLQSYRMVKAMKIFR